jgi:hypothetical protein
MLEVILMMTMITTMMVMILIMMMIMIVILLYCYYNNSTYVCYSTCVGAPRYCVLSTSIAVGCGSRAVAGLAVLLGIRADG